MREAQNWLSRFRAVRGESLALIEGLSAEDCALQSMSDASPLKWHLAHTSWFWETFVLGAADPRYRPFDDRYRYLFNSYYNGIGAQFPRPIRGLLSRPDLDTVLAYRRHVDERMTGLLGARASVLADDARRWGATIAIGLNHEQQHQELMLTDLKHLWSLNPLAPALPGGIEPGAVCAPIGWRGIDGGTVEIGHRGDGFAFDNESPAHRVCLAPFEIAERPVSNGEYLAFIEAGGYDEPRWWLSEGFDHARAQQWQAPLYWRRIDGQWREYTLHGERALDPHAPVCHVSLFEADAYARFRAARLPTEFEWEHAARALPVRGQFADSACRHPSMPVAAQGAQAPLFGGAWAWTSSSYGAYPGFRIADDAIGEYNGKFMINQYVLRGGSCATPADHVRATYRNFFPAAMRWQFTGIRLARDAARPAP